MSPTGRGAKSSGGAHTGWAPAWPWVGSATVIGLVHALVVAQRYHVGSFDDDAAYALVARALASGAGFTARLLTGSPLVGVVPPGYPALLAPLAAIWPTGLVAFRALSLAMFLAIFPLTWTYLGRRHVAQPVRIAVLSFLALSPVLGTYATMVMPEVPFVGVLLVLLLLVDRWEPQPRTLTWAGAGTVACATALLYLKEAGVGLVIGVAGWLVVRRLWHKAAVVIVGPGLLFLPVVVSRASTGVPLIGSRYATDLGTTGSGFLAQAGHVVPHALWTYLSSALPRSILPTDASPLPVNGPISALLAVFQWTVAPLLVIGFVTWLRRHGDAAAVAAPVYLFETLFYPFTNERRVVLILPVVVAWYVLGAAVTMSAARRVTAAARRPVRQAGMAVPAVAVSVALVSLAVQFPRDYLFAVGQDTSAPGGSAYLDFLRALGQPAEVVETDYLWTTALFSGHRTANRAFAAQCDTGSIAHALEADRAGYLLTAALSGPIVDSGCVLDLAAAQPNAVRLFRTARDKASVFELVGPGTAHPDLRDLTATAQMTASPAGVTEVPEVPQTGGDPAGRSQSDASAGGAAVLTWSWPQPQSISQISLGAAAAVAAVTTGVTIESQGPDGTWHPVGRVAGPVGAGVGYAVAAPPGSTKRPAASARVPYLLREFRQPVQATALRITVTVGPGGGDVTLHDFHALGSGSGN